MGRDILNTLIIIGNGFDLHHGLPTSYKGFAEYLRSHDLSLLDNLERVISFTPSDGDIWSRLEENLAHIDMDYIDDLMREYIPSLASDDYYKDMDACQLEAERWVSSLTTDLRHQFSNYISDANNKEARVGSLLKIDANSLFISFNYTRTLERFYNIDEDSILYIHGTFDDEGNIVLGHATDPKTFVKEKPDESMPEGLSDEQKEMWYDDMSNRHIPFLDEARDELASYYARSFKNTKEIIERNKDFFGKLSAVRSLYVLGHSMSDVDIIYFEKFKQFLSHSCRWFVSYYTENDKNNLISALEALGLTKERYELIELNGHRSII